jgi:hypothetical protein
MDMGNKNLLFLVDLLFVLQELYTMKHTMRPVMIHIL